MAKIILLTNLDDVAETDVSLLEKNLEANYPDNYRDIRNGNYVVITKDTTKDVTEKLGVSDGEAGSYLVSRASAYFGYGPADLWEWLRLREDDDD